MLDSLGGCTTELCTSSAFFDILASLSISRVFSSGISDGWKLSCSDIPGAIIKFDYIN